MMFEGKGLTDRIVKLADERKGENITVLDLKKLNYIADYFVIISAASTVQCRSIADSIDDELSKDGLYAHHREQDQGLNWVLMDYGDVVVHIFEQATREFYAIERIWGDAIFMNRGKGKKNAGKSKAKPKRLVKKSRK
ncbi:MAG: ribosome silencing factor [Candidatus Firestonebacteria bacterium]